MSENSGENPSEELNQGIDLSELQNLQFGPDWTETSPTREHRGRSDDRGDRGGDRGRGGPPRKDRRSGGRPERRAPSNRQDGPGGGGGPRREGGFRGGGDRDRGPRGDRDAGPRRGGGRQREGGRQGRGNFQPPFQPTVDVLFYPEDVPFRALTKALRASLRTYELFEIARLILDKPDRFVVVIKQKGSGKGGPGDDADASREPREMAPDAEGGFIMTLPDNVPFDTEDAALGHVLKHQLDLFFRAEEVEVEPPKGSFQFVNRCSITGELLGPPNYHRYQAIVQSHHAERVPHMSFERFTAKIEQVREPEVIDQWVQQMTKATRYILKEPTDDAPPFFESAESAKHYLATQRRSQILRRVEAPRMSGKQIEKMPDGDLRRSIEAMLEQQRRFPLDTANNLRGRLRRMRFNIYKRGSKGVSYVSAVKRRFRDEKTRFSESLEGLIQFIEGHPNILISELPEQYLGFDLEQLRQPLPGTEPTPESAAEPVAEASAPAAESAPAEPTQATEATASAPEEASMPEASVQPEVPAEPAPAPEEPVAEAPAAPEALPTAEAQDATAPEAAETAATPEVAPAAETPSETAPATDTPSETAPVAETAEAEAPQPEAVPEPTEGAATKEATPAEAPAADAEAPAAKPVNEAQPAEAPPPKAAAAKPQDEFPSATPEQKAKIRQLSSDLRWLVAEGYVTEFGDGTLFAPPVMAAPKPKAEAAPTSEAAPATEGTAPAEGTTPTEAAGPTEPAPPVETGQATEASEPIPASEATEPAEPTDSPAPGTETATTPVAEVSSPGEPVAPPADPVPEAAPETPAPAAEAPPSPVSEACAESVSSEEANPPTDAEKPAPVSATADAPKEEKTS